ncbi:MULTISPECIES: acetylxylan esterase [Clostridium]|uniref:acetylxylan esterase n=1 Tax=Clostridium TaxID=1485 RepID=UPI00069D0865|nr:MULTISPECIES: acetylxylan esterase [Clostridium]KOF56240.1 hypothetical protein AGR56_05035 [Clostridium sp. DMHC 10]MCD2346475.1 acetylxylan esterase [Clostridium guangxiense]
MKFNHVSEYEKCENLKLTPEEFKKLIGYNEVKLDNEIELLSKEEFDKYTIKLIRYKVNVNERVEAYALIPKNIKNKVPGILAIHGNKNDEDYKFGKSTAAGICKNDELNYGLELCLNGYVVICPDRFPYESRSFEKSNLYDDFMKKNSIGRKANVSENYRIFRCNELLYSGCTEMANEMFEMKRAIDILQSFEEVNSEKIGIIGSEEGGLFAILTMFLDKRIKVGCCNYNMYFTTNLYNDNNVKFIKGFDMCISIPGLKEYAAEYDILSGIAPRPFIFTQNSKNDFELSFEKINSKVRERYLDMRVPNKYSSIVFNSESSFPQDIREKCYYFIDKWIKNK